MPQNIGSNPTRSCCCCSKEFVSGLIYVAVSQVRRPEDIQIRRFNRAQLLKSPEDPLGVCCDSEEERADLSCCINQQLDSKLFNVCDCGEDFGEEDGNEPEVMPVDVYPDGLVSSYFEKEDDEVIVDLGTVFFALDTSESEFSCPPEHFDIVQLLTDQRVPEERNQFCSEKNAAIDDILSSSIPQLKLVSRILWLRIFQLMGNCLANTDEEIVISTWTLLVQWSTAKNYVPCSKFKTSLKHKFRLARCSA